MYATLSDLRTRFGDQLLIQLSDLTGTGAIDQDKVNSALSDAGNLIDGYARGRYQTPMTPVLSLVTRKACDIALFNLYVNAPPEHVRKGYEDAVKWAKDIKSGDVTLDVAGLETPSAPNIILTADSIVACKRDSLRGL